MIDLITNMHNVLNIIKNFAAGYSTRSSDQMMIDYQGKRYMVTFEELCNADDETMFETMNKYWKN